MKRELVGARRAEHAALLDAHDEPAAVRCRRETWPGSARRRSAARSTSRRLDPLRRHVAASRASGRASTSAIGELPAEGGDQRSRLGGQVVVELPRRAPAAARSDLAARRRRRRGVDGGGQHGAASPPAPSAAAVRRPPVPRRRAGCRRRARRAPRPARRRGRRSGRPAVARRSGPARRAGWRPPAPGSRRRGRAARRRAASPPPTPHQASGSCRLGRSAHVAVIAASPPARLGVEVPRRPTPGRPSARRVGVALARGTTRRSARGRCAGRRRPEAEQRVRLLDARDGVVADAEQVAEHRPRGGIGQHVVGHVARRRARRRRRRPARRCSASTSDPRP